MGWVELCWECGVSIPMIELEPEAHASMKDRQEDSPFKQRNTVCYNSRWYRG